MIRASTGEEKLARIACGNLGRTELHARGFFKHLKALPGIPELFVPMGTFGMQKLGRRPNHKMAAIGGEAHHKMSVIIQRFR